MMRTTAEIEEELAEERKKHKEFVRRKQMNDEIRKLRAERKGDVFGAFGKALKKTGVTMMKGFAGAGEAMNNYYGVKPDNKKSRKSKKFI